jgi:hypothetical protein
VRREPPERGDDEEAHEIGDGDQDGQIAQSPALALRRAIAAQALALERAERETEEIKEEEEPEDRSRAPGDEGECAA